MKTLISSLLICITPGIIGGLATSTSVTTWYPTLVKPPLNPPDWIFGPVWTVLYLLQGISLYLLRTSKAEPDSRLIAYVFFFSQLLFNLLWSILFFGLKSPAAAAIEIGLFVITLIFTIIASYRVHKTASLLLFPYLAWVSFAAYLNIGIWYLNR